MFFVQAVPEPALCILLLKITVSPTLGPVFLTEEIRSDSFMMDDYIKVIKSMNFC